MYILRLGVATIGHTLILKKDKNVVRLLVFKLFTRIHGGMKTDFDTYTKAHDKVGIETFGFVNTIIYPDIPIPNSKIIENKNVLPTS